MDVLEFVRERKRMCSSYKGCDDCPLDTDGCTTSGFTSNEKCKKIIAIIKQWSKDHSRKTRQSVFLEQWPDAVLDRFGVIQLCPMNISAAHRRRGNSEKCRNPKKLCIDCRREFWSAEVE